VYCALAIRAQRDPKNETETVVFINPESRQKFSLNFFWHRDPERFPFQFGTTMTDLQSHSMNTNTVGIFAFGLTAKLLPKA
jgi:hypothetical protein